MDLLLLLTLLLLINSNYCTNNQNLEDFKEDLDSMANQLLKSLKSAHKLDESEEQIRNKRSLEYKESHTNSFQGVHRLRGMVPLFRTCSLALDFTTIVFYGQKYGICVSSHSHSSSAKVSVGQMSSNGWQWNGISWIAKEPQKVVAFVDEDKDTKEHNLYVLTADSASRDGTDVVVINRKNERKTEEQHTVNSRYPTAIAVWKSRTDNSHHLAIANSLGSDATQSYASETFTYNWMGTYFDKYSSMTTYYVKDICAFNIHSNEFLAIANYKSAPNVISVDSEIFKLDIDRKKWRTFQRIRTFGAVDWEFFTFGSHKNEEYFLAVANSLDTSHGHTIFEVNSVIYKFSDDKFVPFQCLPTVGATQMKTFRGRNGEFLLAVSNLYEAVHLYQYNGWHFVETAVQSTAGVMGPGATSLHFDYLPFERSGALVVSNPRHSSGHVFKLDFIEENPLGEWHNRSLSWCANTDEEVARFGTNHVRHELNDVFYVDQRDAIVISDDLILEDIIADSLSTNVLIDESNGELSHKIIDELMKLNEEINKMEANMAQIVDLLTNALRTKGEQVVTASYTLKSVDFSCKSREECNVRQMNTQTLNNDNVVNLFDDILPLNIDHEIYNTMHFENLRVDKDLILKGFINGINSTQIVTKHANHDIIGRKTFTNTVNANEVIVGHLVNDNVINPLTVLLTNRDQVINNSIEFKNNVQVANIEVNAPINGINIDTFYNEIVTKDSDHIITGEKRFHELEMNDLYVRTGSTIDGVDVMQMWNDVLWTYGDQDLVSAINWTDIRIEGNLFVDGFVNGIKIPNDILLTNQNAIIFGNKRFSTDVKLHRIEVANSINGIGLVRGNPNWINGLDLMLKSKLQVIVGSKVFNQIHLGEHSLVAGTVDGIKLSQLKHSLLLRNNSQHFNSLEVSGNVYFDREVILKDTISGIRLEDLYNKALKLRDSHIPSFPHLRLNVANIHSLNCYSINGLNMGNDLMTKQTSQLISGQKTFVNGIEMKSNFVIKSINGIDLSFIINDTLLHESQQYISGEKVFVVDFWVNSLKVKNINNISMEDLIHINRDEIITAPKVLNDIQVFTDLNVDHLETYVINGVNLKQLYENSLLFERPQTLLGRLNVESISIPNANNFETKSINGIDLRQLLSDAVLIDRNQTIFGTKTFLSDISVDHLKFSHTFDDVSEYHMKDDWLLQDLTQTIYANLIFDNNVRVDGNVFMKSPIISGIDLNLLNKNSVKLDELTTIDGPIRFIKPIFSSGHILLSGRIQGIDLDKEAITLNNNHIMNGHIRFGEGLEVEEHLYVNRTIDGVIVEELCLNSVRHNSNQLIRGQTIVSGNVIFKGPVLVGSGLNGVNIEGFYRSVVKVDESANLKGIKKFKQLIVDEPILVNGSIAGIDFNDLLNNYMSLSRDQVVGSPIVFMNDLNINRNLKVNGVLNTRNGFINAINLRHLDSTVLKTYGNQTIISDFTFENNVYFDRNLNIINRKINKIDLNNELMIRGRNNVINSHKVFLEDIEVINNLDLSRGKTIGDIDISEMTKSAVLKNGFKYNIFGKKHFNSLEVEDLVVGLVNGLELSNENLLLNNGNQKIFGNKFINNDFTVNSEINANLINGINIPHLSQRLVLKGNNNTINSYKKFNSPLTVHNVRAFGKVDGVDVNELNYFIGLPIDLLDLRIQIGIEDQRIDSIDKALEQQPIDLEYYELVSSLPSGQTLLSYYNSDKRSHHLFISGQHLNGCQEIEVYEHSSHISNSFHLIAKLYAIDSNSMISFTQSGHRFVLVSNAVTNAVSRGLTPDCLRRNPSTHLSHYGSGPAITQVFKYNQNNNNYQQMALIHSETVSDIKLIQDQYITPCLVFAIPITNSLVFCLDNNQNFFVKEKIPISGIDEISVLRSLTFNTTLMVSTNGLNEIMVSHWSPQLGHFDDSIQTIHISNPIAVIHLTESHKHLSVFLFASQKKSSLSGKRSLNGLVRILRYNHKNVIPFVEVQQIKCSHVLSINSLISDDKQLLVFMLFNDGIDLYRIKGSTGFVKVDQIVAESAYSFVAFNNYDINGRLDGHFTSVAFESNCQQKYRHLCPKQNHILKSKMSAKLSLNH